MVVVLAFFMTLIALLAVSYIAIFYGIARMDDKCNEAWEAVDKHLQDRNDLVPIFVKTVRDCAKCESKTLDAITSAHSDLMGTKNPDKKVAASTELSSALHRLLISVDAYPNLKENASFRQLQTSITDSERKISTACSHYNDYANEYNNIISTFPGVIVANTRFRRRLGFASAQPPIREVLLMQA